jgi:hypothetical protein
MTRQPLQQGLYDATIDAFTAMGMPEDLARDAALVIATDSTSGTPDNPTERTTEQQQAVVDAWDWYAGHETPYDACDSIDDTPYPLAHGQLLGNLAGDVPADIIWRLGQGERDALTLIDDEDTQSRAEVLVERLAAVGIWDDETPLEELLEDSDALTILSSSEPLSLDSRDLGW